MTRGRRPHLDLVANPFTLPGSRLVVVRAPEGGLAVSFADHSRPSAGARALAGLHLLVNGVEREAEWASPALIGFAGGASLVFVDEETLSLSIPDEGAEILLELIGPALTAGYAGGARTEVPSRIIRWVVEGTHAVQRPARADGLATVIEAEPSAGGARLLITVCDEASQAGGSHPIGHPEALVRAAAAWQTWFDRRPAVRSDLAGAAELAWWVLGANQVRVHDDPGRMLIVPNKLTPIAAIRGESMLIAAGLRHGNPDLAWDQLAAFLDRQEPGGRLPDRISDAITDAITDAIPDAAPGSDGGAAPGNRPVAGPPLAAWAAWEVGRSLEDPARLTWALPRLEAAHRWWVSVTATADGLSAYPAGFSGLDGSPLFDSRGVPVEPPDLDAYLAVQDDRMGRIATRVGRARSGGIFDAAAAQRVERLAARRWHGTEGRFVALAGGVEIPVLTALHAMPLLTGRLPGRIAGAVATMLKDPARFWSASPIPTVALDEPSFRPEEPGRGAVSLAINRLLVEGLAVSNHRSLAMDLAERTLAMMVQAGGMPGAWNPLTGSAATLAPSCWSSTAALFLDLAVAVTSGFEATWIS